ncbi:MAG: hypothetical protein WC758_08195 [Candidatus Woesearchaeota archaeon]|jgi:hypothetical protein
MTNNYFLPSQIAGIVNRYIGNEVYRKVDRQTQIELWNEALRMLKLEMTMKFGTFRNYMKFRLKQRGFNSDKEYIELYLAPSEGVKTYNEYQTVKAKQAGFKSRYDRMLKKVNSQGFNTLHEVYLIRYKKRGFNSQKEYRNFLCKKWGVKNYNELTKLKKNIKNERRRIKNIADSNFTFR